MRIADKTYLINLDYRIDRLKNSKSQLEKCEIEYERFPAINARKLGITGVSISNQGLIGCFLSHFFIIQEAMVNKYKSVAVFEDDIIFTSSFKDKFEKTFSQLPKEWELFYMGYYERGDGFKIQVSENLIVPKDTWGTHGYILQNDGIKKMWENLKEIKTHIDVQISQNVMSKLYSYCAFPPLCYQSGIKSDIKNA